MREQIMIPIIKLELKINIFAVSTLNKIEISLKIVNEVE